MRRDLKPSPNLVIGGGALGLLAALREVLDDTIELRSGFQNTGSALNAMPKSIQPKAKGHLHDFLQAQTKADADAAFDFPAKHWEHIRTTNPIESAFATEEAKPIGAEFEKLGWPWPLSGGCQP